MKGIDTPGQALDPGRKRPIPPQRAGYLTLRSLHYARELAHHNGPLRSLRLGMKSQDTEHISEIPSGNTDLLTTEPVALLCRALIQRRMEKKVADYQLARAMLENIYLLPDLLGKDREMVDMWHSH